MEEKNSVSEENVGPELSHRTAVFTHFLHFLIFDFLSLKRTYHIPRSRQRKQDMISKSQTSKNTKSLKRYIEETDIRVLDMRLSNIIREGKYYRYIYIRSRKRGKERQKVETPFAQEGDSVTDLRAGGSGRGLGHVIRNRGVGSSAWAYGPCD